MWFFCCILYRITLEREIISFSFCSNTITLELKNIYAVCICSSRYMWTCVCGCVRYSACAYVPALRMHVCACVLWVLLCVCLLLYACACVSVGTLVYCVCNCEHVCVSISSASMPVCVCVWHYLSSKPGVSCSSSFEPATVGFWNSLYWSCTHRQDRELELRIDTTFTDVTTRRLKNAGEKAMKL